MPPWRLSGQGWLMLMRWPAGWLREHGWLGERPDRFLGGPGALMLVDYQDCPIGPYRELLMIPGRFRTPFGARPSITRILVSTQASVDLGRANWAIPKTLGEFEISREGTCEQWQISEAGQSIARFELSCAGPAAPVRSSWCPRALRSIAQPDGEQWLQTSPQARGRIKLGRLRQRWSEPASFPDPTKARCLLCVRVDPFEMSFPLAEHSVAPV
jgi:hypothetical protein